MCFLNTYKVKIDLAGLEASLTGKVRQKNILIHNTYKFQKNLAGLEASLAGKARQKKHPRTPYLQGSKKPCRIGTEIDKTDSEP